MLGFIIGISSIEFKLAKYRKALGEFTALKQKERSLYNPDSFEERVERKLLNVIESFENIQENGREIDKVLDDLEKPN